MKWRMKVAHVKDCILLHVMHAQKKQARLFLGCPICHTHIWLWSSGTTPDSTLWVNCNNVWFHKMKQFGDTDLKSVVHPWHTLLLAFLSLYLVMFCLCVHISIWRLGVFNEKHLTLLSPSSFLLSHSFCSSITFSDEWRVLVCCCLVVQL